MALNELTRFALVRSSSPVFATFGESTEFNDLQLLHILRMKTRTVILSPWMHAFNLLDYSDYTEQEELPSPKPYTVHSLNGIKMYQVFNHDGVFGRSEFDTNLVLSAKHGELFYITYSTVRGDRQLLLAVNKVEPRGAYFLRKLNQNTGRTYSLPEDQNIVHLQFNSTVASSLYFLPVAYELQPGVNDLLDNPITTVTEFTRESGVWFPDRSGWFCIRRGVNTLTATPIGSTGGRFKQGAPKVYYVAAGNEVDRLALMAQLNHSEISRRLNINLNVT